MIPEESLEWIGGQILSPTYYVFPFTADYVPDGTETVATIAALVGEFTGYDAAARPAAGLYYSAGGLMTNAGAEPTINITQPARLYGHVVISAATKLGTSGRVLDVHRWAAFKDVAAGDTLTIKAGITAIPTNI
jgi:hypothetical protein